jgi:hypothetical protein
MSAVMRRISFEDIERVYLAARFVGDGKAEIIATDGEILEILSKVHCDEVAQQDSGIFVESDADDIVVNQKYMLQVKSPRLALGVLANDFDQLLVSPQARYSEPLNYFIISDRLRKSDDKIILEKYRAVLRLVRIFELAADLFDKQSGEMIFFREDKAALPVTYTAREVHAIDLEEVDELISLFDDQLHGDEKLRLLGDAIVSLVRSQPIARRFEYLITNVDFLSQEVSKGYQLYISTFSYSKVKSEIEQAKIDYIAKIHKTIVDIQGQLLGIPIATIVAATQLKIASACGVEFWSNVGITFGAYVFAILLIVAILNQWATLTAISEEVRQQKNRIKQKYPLISDEFHGIFDSLNSRVCWHKCGLFSIGAIVVIGLIIAQTAFNALTKVSLMGCW